MLPNGKIISCEICGKDKYFAKWEQKIKKHFYCSQTCNVLGRSKFYSGELGCNWQGGKIEVECSECGIKLFKEKNQLNKSNRYYCSDICMGKYYSKNMAGENHPNFGRKFPEFSERMKKNNPMKNKETKEKVSKSLKKAFKDGTWINRTGSYHSLESRLKQSLAKGGNGIKFVDRIYPGIFGTVLKKRIKDRDDHICQCCFQTEEQEIEHVGRRLPVHHIDYNKFNCVDTNLITVCLYCNNIANGDREYWFAYYTYLIQEKISEGVIKI